MRPFDNTDGRTVHQQTGHGSAPNDLIDDAVRSIGVVAKTIAIKIECAVVAPIIASSALSPIKETGADVFDLINELLNRLVPSMAAVK